MLEPVRRRFQHKRSLERGYVFAEILPATEQDRMTRVIASFFGAAVSVMRPGRGCDAGRWLAPRSLRRKEECKIMDFRRSGAVEMLAGGVTPEVMAGKMANTIDQNAELQAVYLPHNAAVVRLADEGRLKGRRKMRSGGKT
jgi:hypothetical protein